MQAGHTARGKVELKAIRVGQMPRLSLARATRCRVKTASLGHVTSTCKLGDRKWPALLSQQTTKPARGRTLQWSLSCPCHGSPETQHEAPNPDRPPVLAVVRTCKRLPRRSQVQPENVSVGKERSNSNLEARASLRHSSETLVSTDIYYFRRTDAACTCTEPSRIP